VRAVTHREAAEAGFCPPWSPPHPRTTLIAPAEKLAFRRARAALVREFKARYESVPGPGQDRMGRPLPWAQVIFDEYRRVVRELEESCRSN
jgi:hypothetical protein